MSTNTAKPITRPSRKQRVHGLHDKEGPASAWTLGRRLKLKEGTLRTWFRSWNRDAFRAWNETVKGKVPADKTVKTVKNPEPSPPVGV